MEEVPPESQLCWSWWRHPPNCSPPHSCSPGIATRALQINMFNRVGDFPRINFGGPPFEDGIGSLCLDLPATTWTIRFTCQPSLQKHSPCLYTALSTIKHSPWPWKVRTLFDLKSDWLFSIVAFTWSKLKKGNQPNCGGEKQTCPTQLGDYDIDAFDVCKMCSPP